MKDIFEIPENEKNEGFTLMEVLIALCLFSISMLALGALQLNSMQSVTSADTLTKASTLAHSQIELLKNVPMDNVRVAEGTSAIVANDRFWIQQIVTDDSPMAARDIDSGAGPVSTTVCKTITITVFADAGGSKTLASGSFIKSFTAIE